MTERFFKYHALGNDFVVLDRRQGGGDISAQTSREWCDRRRGIGADGVLTILPEAGTAGRMVVHNADGSIAEMCGNGIRCVVKYLAEHSGDQPRSLEVATGAGVLRNEIDWADGHVSTVTVQMGPARLTDRNLPKAPEVTIDGVTGTPISMGNPHLVLLDTPPSEATKLGAKLELSPLFPERTNVEFCRPRAAGGIEVTVWERGVGLTQACGTGACAAVAAHTLKGRVPFDAWVPVELPGGVLQINVRKDLGQVLLRGPATLVFDGEL
ncbi:MAG: diaminopimelate epimerase [Myxococcaceae bacterium]